MSFSICTVFLCKLFSACCILTSCVHTLQCNVPWLPCSAKLLPSKPPMSGGGGGGGGGGPSD